MTQQLLLCTDMDRTIIPNGHQPEHSEARSLFRKFCALPEVTLVYVTGRHLALVEDAITKYHLPTPDYAITDVGTKINHQQSGHWQTMTTWETEIGKAWGNIHHQQIAGQLHDIEGLSLQETEKQNTHKVSFYADLAQRSETEYLSETETLLAPLNIQCSLIWSIDEAENIGLLDVLPKNATKLHAVEFLQQQLNYSYKEVIFAGDSGNDLPVLVSPVQSILVANASEEIKQQALRQTLKNQTDNAFYQAQNTFEHMGNYSAGVLQGVAHYSPYFRPILKEWGIIDD